jgi:hypothetical protein
MDYYSEIDDKDIDEDSLFAQPPLFLAHNNKEKERNKLN